MNVESTPPVSIESRGSVTVVQLQRPISESQNLAEIESMLRSLVNSLEHPKLVIDFAKVSFFPSIGVGLIIGTRNEVASKHGVLAIACMSELIEHMFTLTGLTKVLPVFDSVDEAVDALSQNDAEH